jgi:hypothetical protein
MLAVVHATFTLTFDGGQTIETPPVTFVVRSRPGVAIGPSQVTKELADKIESLPGWKAHNVLTLMSDRN